MSGDSDTNPFSEFIKDDRGVVWGMIVVAMTLIGAMLVFAVMGPIFDEMYTVAHATNGSFNVSEEGLSTFDTMYNMVGLTPIIILFSAFLFMLVRAIMQEM